MRGGKTYKRGVVCMQCFSAKDVNFARLILRGKRRILRVESSSSTVVSGVVVIKTLLERSDESPPQAEKIFGPAHCCR